MARIAFIAEPLCNPMPNGIKTYAGGLIKDIVRLDKDNRYLLITSTRLSGFDIEQVVIPFPKGIAVQERRNLSQLPKILERLDLDIVHEFTHFGPFLGKNKFKKILNVYDIIPLLYPETRPNRLITYFRHKWGLPIILGNTDRVIAISNCTKIDLIRNYNIHPDKIKVIYGAVSTDFRRFNSAELSFFRNKESIDFPFILTVGTLEPRKNLEFLINVFRQFTIRYNVPYKLIIVGNRDRMHKDMFARLKSLGHGLEVIIKEHVPNEDLTGYYNLADLFVFPSLYEGFGLPVLEAINCGCPVIASDIPSVREIVKDKGILLPLWDMNMWVDSAYKLLSNRDLRNKMVNDCLEESREFSWDKSAREVLALYDSLLD